MFPPPLQKPTIATFTSLSNPLHVKVVDEEVEAMLEKGAIEEVPPSLGYYSRVFVVPKKDGGWRPIINLKKLNKTFISPPPHFRMDTDKDVAFLLRPGDWAATIDLKDAYFHVSVHHRHRRFLRFGWKGKLYQYLVLPFGLGWAPFIFTMLTKPIVAFLRSRQIRVIFYLDDILVIGRSEEECRDYLNFTLHLLQFLGFLINQKKSNLVPSQNFRFLGLLWDTQSEKICLPEEKLAAIHRLSSPLLSKPPTCHALQVLLGHMTSSIPAVPLVRLHARPLQRDLAAVYKTEKDSKKRVLLSDFSKESLRWILSLDIHQCMAPMWPLQIESCDLEVSTDASNLGWGIHFDGRLHQGRWDADAPAHINAKELFTLHIFLRDFLPSSILPRSLLWRTDNTTAMAYVKKEGGTISQSLLQIATQLLLLAEEKQIRILPVYVPSEENLLADAASRFQSLPDWHLNPSVFNMICRRWGSPVIDLFATDLSSQLPRFFAWGQSQRAEAFDALLQPWAFTLAYAFPPPALLPRTLNKIAVSQGEFLLVVPFWPTQKWFPVLLEMNILEVRRLPLLPDIVTDLTTQSPPRNLSLLHLLVLKILGGSTHRQSLTTRSGSLPEVGEDLQPRGMTQSGERSRIFSLPDEFRSIKLI